MYVMRTDPMPSRDERWYRQLKPLMDEVGETFVVLMPSDAKLQRAYAEFHESGYVSNPDLLPDTVNVEKLESVRAKLDNLRQHIEDNESSVEIRELYIARIKEVIANISMIVAASGGNRREFDTANRFIYGEPDPKIFAASCAWVRHDAVHANIDEQLRKRLLEVVPDRKGDVTFLTPSSTTFQAVKKEHFQTDGYIDQLFKGVLLPADENITPVNGDSIVRQVIQNIGSSFDLVDSPTGLWSVIQSKHHVVRPVDFSLSKTSFMAIIAHEIGSHLLESTNGANASLKLLELGLDRYEAGNEGRAFLREQIMFDSFDDYINQPQWTPSKASWEYRVAIHMAISLATGLHTREYSFAEIYQILIILFTFWTAKRKQPINDDIIAMGAWNMAVRALKGTRGQGGAYVKDIVYLEGTIRCWQAATDNASVILDGDVGKFDIANKGHISSLSKLGIL